MHQEKYTVTNDNLRLLKTSDTMARSLPFERTTRNVESECKHLETEQYFRKYAYLGSEASKINTYINDFNIFASNVLILVLALIKILLILIHQKLPLKRRYIRKIVR